MALGNVSSIRSTSFELAARILAPASVLILLVPLRLTGQWSADPGNNLFVAYGLLPESCSDSAGGAYVTYEVSSTYPRHVALRRLNRYGYQPWNTSFAILGTKPESRFASMSSDGHNGVLVGYLDREWNTDPNIPWYNDRVRVQRIDSSGSLLWGAFGVRVSTDEHAQNAGQYPAIAADGFGGCIVVWLDSLRVVRVQRLDSLGQRVLGDTGRVVAPSSQFPPTITKIDADHYVVTYGRLLKCIASNGDSAWADSVGFRILSAAPGLSARIIVAGRSGTASNILITSQALDASGHHTWPDPFIVLAESTSAGSLIALCADRPTGQVTFGWNTQRNGGGGIYTQTVRPDGSSLHPHGGIPVGLLSSQKQIVGLASADSETTVYLWSDQRSPTGIYAQRLDTTGTTRWDTSDVLVSAPPLSNVSVITDGHGGIIDVGFAEDFSVRAQQVSRRGILGQVVTSIAYGRPTAEPEAFVLRQNFPNPFNSTTTIGFDLPVATLAKIEVYNLLGQEVGTISEGFLAKGSYRIQFDAQDFASGVYFYRLETPRSTQNRKLTILK